jgi:hypothetical protein
MTRDWHVQVIEFIIKCLLLLIPVININEIQWAIGIVGERGGFFLIKYIKDIGFFTIILLSILGVIHRQKLPKSYLILPFCLIFIGLCVFISMDNTPALVLLAGLRWCVPFLLCIFLYNNVNRDFMESVSYIAFFMLVINLVFQLFELKYMPPYNGLTYFGLSARTPGIFSHAHSCASFICLSYLLINEFVRKNMIRILANIFVVFGIVLSMSSTGVICLITMISFQRIKKAKTYPILILLVPIIVLIVYSFADVLTNRSEGSSESSIETRRDFFLDIFNSTGLISNTFGQATGLPAMLNMDYIPADAFYASFLANLGLIPFIILILFVSATGFIAIIKKNTLLINVLLLYGLFAFSIGITEMFPINLFLSVLVSCIIKGKNNTLIK